MHDIISQHYQKDADGLCCRLKHSIDKAKDVEYVVSMSDFKDSTFFFNFLLIGMLIFFFPLVGGWAIPRRDLTKKSPIGKGEFGGEREREREGGRKGERENTCYCNIFPCRGMVRRVSRCQSGHQDAEGSSRCQG